MENERPLFSESWHRVAQQKIRLRPSVKVRKQFFRGEQWHVAHDAYGDQFFRFRPEAWDFISRLDGTRTVEEIWKGCLERNKDRAPGQGEAVQMLAQLYNGNLIISDVPADVGQLFDRYKKRKSREWKSRIFGIFFLRIPLWDPDNFLNRTINWVKPLLSVWGALLWLIVFGAGLSVVISNWEQLFSARQGILDPSNLPLLYLAFAFAKLVHEFGHGYAVKRFKGEVHRMGITILVFTPIPFVDATAAWAFRERWKRVWVGCAGMIVELFLAAIAAFIWAATGPGLVNSLAYNTMVVASVSTILFNINPLLRFDGYYILSDLTDTPNLQPRGSRQLLHGLEKYIYGGRFSQSPSSSSGEAVWLGSFGVLAYCYRLFITFTIIIFVADKYLGLGLLAGILTVIGMFVIPFVKGIKYLFTEPRIERVRTRALSMTAAFIALVFFLLGVVPAPSHVRAPGVLKADDSTFVTARAGGFVDEVIQRSGVVESGQALLRLASPDLMLEIRALEAELEHIDVVERQAMRVEPSGLAVLRQRRLVTELRLAELYEQRDNLVLRASRDGEWVAPELGEMMGRWIWRGSVLGEIVSGDNWEFLAVVSQDSAGALFDYGVGDASIRFPGSRGLELKPDQLLLVPGRQDYLPSPALGWAGGGPIQVDQRDESGMRAAEPFFLVLARVPGSEQILWHGRTGIVRLQLPSEPLLKQWGRSFRQLLQRRFQI